MLSSGWVAATDDESFSALAPKQEVIMLSSGWVGGTDGESFSASEP